MKTIHLLLITIIWIIMPGCRFDNQKQETNEHSINFFYIKRGVNISHWLSQSDRRGEDRKAFITKSDIDLIAAIGYDHIRLPIDEEQMWDEEGNRETEAFELLHNGIQWALENELKVIVDLHILRSHYFNAKEKPLWTDPAEQDKFIRLWEQLSEELMQYSVDDVAYELMNEAVADDPDDWNKLLSRGIEAIRNTEPDRKIVVGSNRWQGVETFPDLNVPENDENIILSFHFYTPFLLTHHTASWTKIGEYTGPVHYPGKSIKEEDLKGLPEDLLSQIKNFNHVYTKDTLEKLIQIPVNYANNHQLQLYCGEWGCLPEAPKEDRMQWYADMRSILENHSIAWANWDYKGSFGVVDREGNKHDELIEVLLK